MSNKKICFVIMGFGKKKDPETNRTINLDATYKKIILPAVQSSRFTCIRADEILESGIIDRSMFALLYSADLVIADISTYNPNALYELGIRHALRPYSTIIIKEDGSKNPFDINHNRTLSYKHAGDVITDIEAKNCIRNLKTLIDSVTNNPLTDSPLYSYIPKIQQPTLTDEDLNEIIGELKSNENTIYSLTEKAKSLMEDEKFSNAAVLWQKLSKKSENEIYYIQQEALCTYKSKLPSEMTALTNALKTIEYISDQTDSETLGITGAIYKNLWKLTQDLNYLDYAIEKYKMGWNLYKDYYTGENYAHCLEKKSTITTENELSNYLNYEAKLTRIDIIKVINNSISNVDCDELKWKYATLSNCNLSLGELDKAIYYEKEFLCQEPSSWEIKTFQESKLDIINYKKKEL